MLCLASQPRKSVCSDHVCVVAGLGPGSLRVPWPKLLNQSSVQILQGRASGLGERQGPGHHAVTQPSRLWAEVMGSQRLLGLFSLRRAWRRTAGVWREWGSHSLPWVRHSSYFSRSPTSWNMTLFPGVLNTWEILEVRQYPRLSAFSCQDRLERLETAVVSCLCKVMSLSERC